MRVAVVSPRDPIPVYTGLLERVYQLCRYLGRDHEVRLFYPHEKQRKATEEGRVPDEQPFERIGLESKFIDVLEGIVPDYSAVKGLYHLHPWLYPGTRSRLHQFDPELVVVEFPYLMPLVRAACRGLDCRIVLTEHNVEYELARRLGVPLWQALYRYETFACNLADAVVTVSETDRSALAPHVGDDVALRVAPNGVDVDRYHPDLAESDAAEAVRRTHDLTSPVFVYHGNLGNAQNAEAVDALLETVFPAIRDELGDASLLLVGADPPETEQPGVVTAGLVDDLPAYLGAGDVAIVPLRSGSGTKLKILEYLSIGVPVVTTPVGAEGLPLHHEENALVVEDHGEAFAAEAVRLARDDDLRERVGDAGRELAVSRFSWSRTLTPYDEFLDADTDGDARKRTHGGTTGFRT